MFSRDTFASWCLFTIDQRNCSSSTVLVNTCRNNKFQGKITFDNVLCMHLGLSPVFVHQGQNYIYMCINFKSDSSKNTWREGISWPQETFHHTLKSGCG